jgi:hypothetical protein
MKPICQILTALLTAVSLSPQPAPADEKTKSFQRSKYTIQRTGSPLKIDGKLNEPAWESAQEIRNFHFTWWKSGKKEQSRAKLLWDDKYLYVGHVCQDAHITARVKKHDGPVAKDDCFEVMLTPNADKPNVYFNIEWNVLGTWVDNHRPNGPKNPKAKVWDAQGVKIVGTYEGTLNNDQDQDRQWTVEVAIPFENFAKFAKNTHPQAGDQWFLNLNRHGGDTNLQYSQWSPGDTPTPAFHTPHRFGVVTFSSKTVSKK